MSYLGDGISLSDPFAPASNLMLAKRQHRTVRRGIMRECLCAFQAALSIFRLLWANMQGRTEASVIEHPFPSGVKFSCQSYLEVSLVRSSVLEKETHTWRRKWCECKEEQQPGYKPAPVTLCTWRGCAHTHKHTALQFQHCLGEVCISMKQLHNFLNKKHSI